MKQPHILIVGQGLAGTILSHTLTQRGVAHHVMDNHHRFAATHAAAGIINPITGRRYVKSWLIDTLIPAAVKCYRQFEDLLDSRFLKEVRIYRTLSNTAQENNWLTATDRPGYDRYAKGMVDKAGAYSGHLNEKASYGIIDGALQVDISRLINEYRRYLIGRDMMIDTEFDFKKFDPQHQPTTIEGISFDLIIFSEGFKAIDNPYFNYLPFQPVKGEALIVSMPDLNAQEILRDEIFLVPFGKNVFWSGGGYEKQFEDHMPGRLFACSWRDRIRKLITIPFKQVDHKAGIRPSVRDRRPIIGKHPRYRNLAIFNGMGTKGTSLGPYWAGHFVEHILDGTPLDLLVNISRFESLYKVK